MAREAVGWGRASQKPRLHLAVRDPSDNLRILNVAVHPTKPLAEQARDLAKAVVDMAKHGELPLEPSALNDFEKAARGDTHTIHFRLIGVRPGGEQIILKEYGSAVDVSLESLARDLENSNFSEGIVELIPVSSLGDAKCSGW